MIDHISQAKPGLKPFPDRLHVVTAISNPRRYRKRYELFWAFEHHVKTSGAVLWVGELQQGERPFEVTERDNPHHFQFRTYHELWHKENILNAVINRLPPEARYIAWLDSDITFNNPRWAQETIQMLQHYDVVQVFSHCMDLSHDFEPVIKDGYNDAQVLPGMFYNYVHGIGWDTKPNFAYHMSRSAGHCGYGYAARRSAIDTMGGLIDFSICGSNDRQMAYGWLGRIEETIHPQASDGFKRAMLEWQRRALRLNMNIGYVSGLITHHFHGDKKFRRYVDRWQILINNEYDPYKDIFKDSQGIYQLNPDKQQLRNDLRAYFSQRNEDSLYEPPV